MTDLDERIEETFNDYKDEFTVVEVGINRKSVRVGVVGEIDDDLAEELVEKSITEDEEYFGFSTTTESRDDLEDIVTVINFRIK